MVSRCEFRHSGFKNNRTWNGDKTDQCWMTKTVEDYDGNYLCCFHMPYEEISKASEKLQVKILKRLLNEWNDDEQINSFVIPMMHCGEVNLSEMKFKSKVNFSEATFSDEASFSNATFNGPADFSGSTFGGNAFFRDVTFSDHAYFSNTTFRAFTQFYDATFSSHAFFQDATFNGPADFSGSTFGGPADFNCSTYSSDANFNQIEFLYGPNMAKTDFLQAPGFHNTSFGQSVDFREAKFRDRESRNAPPCYRTLKLAMNKVSNKTQEAIFYAYEQESLRLQHDTLLSKKWMSYLYQISSNYGQSFFRPFNWLIVVYFLFSAIYSFINYPVFTKLMEYGSLGFPNFWNKLASMLQFSGINIVSPFKVWTGKGGANVVDFFGAGTTKIAEISIIGLATLQSIICLALITLTILAIRRTFKLN